MNLYLYFQHSPTQFGKIQHSRHRLALLSFAEISTWKADPYQWEQIKFHIHKVHPCTGHMAHKGSRSIALLFHDQWHQKRVRGQCHTPAALYPPGKTQYPLYSRLGGSQGRSGQARKISPLPGFDPRTAQPIASRYTDYTTRPTV